MYPLEYIYQRKDWPQFRWDEAHINSLLSEAHYYQGLLLGQMKALGFQFREESALETLTEDVLKSSEIEGEILDTQQVRSSVAKQLGLDVTGLPQADREVEGIVQIMFDATSRCDQPLT